MQARSLITLGILALTTYAVAMTLVASNARAHGDAAWIMENPLYVDAAGTHCCGPSDCHRDMAAKFREAPEGIWVTIGAGDAVLMPRRLVARGLYTSIDADWWICVRGGEVKCVFKPTTEG